MPPRSKKVEPISAEVENDVWYTAGEAAKKLTENSHRYIDPDYLFKLGKLGKIRTKKMGPRTTLYHKSDVDGYMVEFRGVKSGAAKRLQAEQRRKQQPS